MFNEFIIKAAFEKYSIIVIKGAVGTGKSTAIQNFLKKNKIDYHYVTTFYENDSTFNLLNENGFKGNTIETSLVKLKKRLRKNPVVFLNNMDKYGEANIAKIINSIAGISNIKIIISINSHSKNCETIIEKLPSSSKQVIEFTSKDVNEYIINNKNELFKELDTSNISENQLTKYLEVCDNFLLLFDIKETMQYEYINKEFIGNDSALDFVERVIQDKFEKLTEEMKNILKKSAVIGEFFDKNLLTSPLGLLNINKTLDLLIKEHTIKKNDNVIGEYQFAPLKAREIIYNSMENINKNELNELLGDFYFGLYKKANKINFAFNYLSKSISFYNKISENNLKQDGVSRCFLFIKLCFSFNILDNIVHNAVHCLNQCTDIPLMHSYRMQILYLCEKNSLWQEALCILEQTNNSTAISLKEIEHINYIKASCFFNTNEEAKALEIFKKLYSETLDDKLFKFKILSWLYSIYYDKGDGIKKDKYLRLLEETRKSLPINDFTKYEIYNYYRKIGMNANFPEVIKKIEEAIKYFKKESLLIDLAKCQHNLGTAYMCNQNYDEALKMFENSMKNFGLSSNIVYPLMGICAIYCLKNENYIKAYEIYSDLLNKYSIDNFIKIEIYFNLASCCYKIKNNKLAEVNLNEADKLIAESLDNNYESYFYKQFRDLFIIMRDIENGNPNLDMMQNFNAKDNEYVQLKNSLIAHTLNKECPYKQYITKILDDIIKKNIFPHYLLFWE